jgi:hypothetical protein
VGAFNLAYGILGTMLGTAAAIGTGALGLIVHRFGSHAGFLTIAAGVLARATLLWILPETKPATYTD